MTGEVREFVKEKSRELMESATCSAEAREAAKAWLEEYGRMAK